MTRRAAFLLICLVGAACAAHAGELPKQLDYRSALMEYYAAYCGTLGAKEEEEAYIVLSPDKFDRHARDEAQKQKDLSAVRETLKKALAKVSGGTHEYTVPLRAELGEYDETKGGFACIVAREGSCLDIKPLPEDTAVESARQVLARGLLFNKVHTIKLFFSNPGQFTVLKCPAAKARQFLGDRGREVFIMMRVEILPGAEHEYKRRIDDISNRMRMTGIESSYVMLARIKSIEVYDDTGLQNRLGAVENDPGDPRLPLVPG